ncbi:glycerophosphoryl diester phosphodiesterase [Paenibacillus sp. J31TS4]|uniref:glycerophosphodiester phosphodiesterase family protein n=1 Tax=Paenibacillus sp. J31TS4 TaxID=2807195 RepID=UPI001B2C3064|nr:glycerophosphodiester phosphodiesterase family protein [Paenibacillus sp. J31TS4]GIP39385.1 glycerophosphoryl diester phosphodiesterase [Paenibacillus sp. J31TS4]
MSRWSIGRKRRSGRGRRLRRLLGGAAVLVLLVYLNNASWLAGDREGGPLLLAHRGIAQTFPMEGIENDTCTAERIHEPEHPYLENTIASMEAAFAAGADVVELDVKPTKDGRFAVFHDWTLDCRTDGKGVTTDYTMAELKQLDIGYGYTADGGRSYPFRGKGVGLMPSLDEVLARFPDRELLVHMKSRNAEEGKQLAQTIAALPEERRSRLTVYGDDEPVAALRELLPQQRAMSKALMKSCLLPYEALGWTGYVPKACRGTEIHLPEGMAPWVWGWPNRFVNRMAGADVRVIVVGGDGSGFSSGFDQPGDLERLPAGYTGGIWTNRIDLIAPVYKGK